MPAFSFLPAVRFFGSPSRRKDFSEISELFHDFAAAGRLSLPYQRQPLQALLEDLHEDHTPYRRPALAPLDVCGAVTPRHDAHSRGRLRAGGALRQRPGRAVYLTGGGAGIYGARGGKT